MKSGMCAPDRPQNLDPGSGRRGSVPWPKQDDGRARQADRSANEVPAVGLAAFDQPQSGHGRGDIDPAIGHVGLPGRVGIDRRQAPGKGRQRRPCQGATTTRAGSAGSGPRTRSIPRSRPAPPRCRRGRSVVTLGAVPVDPRGLVAPQFAVPADLLGRKYVECGEMIPQVG